MSWERTTFRRVSTTFYISSLFFPSDIKKSVFELYSFVRVADDYVDQLPQNSEGFYRLRKIWNEAYKDPDFNSAPQKNDSTDMRVVRNMLRVTRKHSFDSGWTELFLDSMQSDLTHKPCQTIDDTLRYTHGSAEVIGLMMAKIMDLKPVAYEAAKLQGRAMQAINFIRDINEDTILGRLYLPASELKQFNLPDLTLQTATRQSDDFTKFIHFQLDRYEKWQAQSYSGYKYIPKRLRIPIQTATDMYNWSAGEIRRTL